MRVQAFTCGWVIGPFRGEEHGDVRLPVPCFVIDHPQGGTLVDTGLHPGMRDHPHARVGWVADILKFEIAPSDDVCSKLRAAGVDPAQLRFLVNTHLHFDHAGGNALIPPHVELVVQRREWQAGANPAQIESNHYNPDDYALERPVQEVDGEHDLYGDGSAVLIPTPGHTPGHQSLRLRVDSGELLICADACYFADWMDSEETPPYGFDKQQELESLRRLRALRDAGAEVIYGHDPAQWETLPQAPATLAGQSAAA